MQGKWVENNLDCYSDTVEETDVFRQNIMGLRVRKSQIQIIPFQVNIRSTLLGKCSFKRSLAFSFTCFPFLMRMTPYAPSIQEIWRLHSLQGFELSSQCWDSPPTLTFNGYTTSSRRQDWRKVMS